MMAHVIYDQNHAGIGMACLQAQIQLVTHNIIGPLELEGFASLFILVRSDSIGSHVYIR
jgi:hypothetical protein